MLDMCHAPADMLLPHVCELDRGLCRTLLDVLTPVTARKIMFDNACEPSSFHKRADTSLCTCLYIQNIHKRRVHFQSLD